MDWVTRDDLRSWGRPAVPGQRFALLQDRAALLPDAPDGTTMLPRGNGRSYGDSCSNAGGALLGARGLDRFIAFDREQGLLECEAGVLLGEILRLVLPAGWMLPVVPGTRFVTVGGAIANDVHGKNHHVAGSFGAHLESLVLRRSDGGVITCSRSEGSELFSATIGGLGLTGLIVSARLRLARAASAWVDVETTRFASLRDFAAQTLSAETTHEHVVAWLDTSGAVLGRGLLLRANGSRDHERDLPRERALAVPLEPPVSLVSRPFVRAFNAAYLRRVPVSGSRTRQHLLPFHFPLDAIAHWNRVYGPRGFYQYQCVVPTANAEASIGELLARIFKSGERPFLTVLKRLGESRSPGLMSFPREGWTLALDFPDRGAATHSLFGHLDEVVDGAGGRLYPAKDARMSPAMFRRGYPHLDEFARWVDPAFSSSFWRRVSEPLS